MKAIVSIVLVVLLATFTGCVTPLNTPSGRPEVTVTGATTNSVKGALINEMLNDGYVVKRSDENIVVCEKAMDNFAAQMLYGSNFNRQPNARITYNLIELGSSIRIVAQIEIITNPDSGLEQVTPLNNGKDANDVQNMLTRIAARLDISPHQANTP